MSWIPWCCVQLRRCAGQFHHGVVHYTAWLPGFERTANRQSCHNLNCVQFGTHICSLPTHSWLVFLTVTSLGYIRWHADHEFVSKPIISAVLAHVEIQSAARAKGRIFFLCFPWTSCFPLGKHNKFACHFLAAWWIPHFHNCMIVFQDIPSSVISRGTTIIQEALCNEESIAAKQILLWLELLRHRSSVAHLHSQNMEVYQTEVEANINFWE